MNDVAGSPFNTEQAATDFDNVEQRLWECTLDDDESSQHTIRFSSWQKYAMKDLMNTTGTNVVQVGYCCYIEGADKIREVIPKEEVEDYDRLTTLASNLATQHRHTDHNFTEFTDKAIGFEVEDPVDRDSSLGEPTTLTIKDSYWSESKKSYRDKANFNAWIHRVAVVVGFLASDTLGDMIIDKVEEYPEVVKEAFWDSRANAEDNIKKLVSDNLGFWVSDGIYEEQLEEIEESYSLMETSKRESVGVMLDSIKREAEIMTKGDDDE